MVNFICDISNCGKQFTKRSNLEAHKRVHSDAKPYSCNYEGCEASYFRLQHLKRHEEKIHSHPEKEFKCTEVGCVASFDTEFGLVQHSNRVHPCGKSVLSCSFCELKFEKDWQIKEHEASHTKILPFRCENCDQQFDAYTNFKIHKKEHKKVQPVNYKCDQCSETFETLAKFQKHNHLEPPTWTCDQCQKMFHNEGNFQKHQTTHLENRNDFRCHFENCARIYHHKRNLTNHIRTAHEGNLYACNICERKLSSKQKLQYHLSQHLISPAERKQKARDQRQPNEKLFIKKLANQLSGSSSKNILELPKKKGKRIRTKHITHILASRQEQLDSVQIIYPKEESQNIKYEYRDDDEHYEQVLQFNEF